MKRKITIEVKGKIIAGTLKIITIEDFDDFTPVGYKARFSPDDVRYPECFVRGRSLQATIGKLPQRMIDRLRHEAHVNQRINFLTR